MMQIIITAVLLIMIMTSSIVADFEGGSDGFLKGFLKLGFLKKHIILFLTLATFFTPLATEKGVDASKKAMDQIKFLAKERRKKRFLNKSIKNNHDTCAVFKVSELHTYAQRSTNYAAHRTWSFAKLIVGLVAGLAGMYHMRYNPTTHIYAWRSLAAAGGVNTLYYIVIFFKTKLQWINLE